MRPPIVSAVDCVSYLSANRTKPRAFFAAIEITEVAMRDAVVVLTRRKRGCGCATFEPCPGSLPLLFERWLITSNEGGSLPAAGKKTKPGSDLKLQTNLVKRGKGGSSVADKQDTAICAPATSAILQ